MRKIPKYLTDYQLLNLMLLHSKRIEEVDFTDEMTDIQYVLTIISDLILEVQEKKLGIHELEDLVDELRDLIVEPIAKRT